MGSKEKGSRKKPRMIGEAPDDRAESEDPWKRSSKRGAEKGFDKRTARSGPRKGKAAIEELPERKGIPTRFIAPIAVIVAILVIGAIVLVLVMNSGSSISEIFVGNIEPRDMDDDLYPNDPFRETLLVPFYANSNGWSSAKGTATLEITYGTDPTVLYSEKVEISEGAGSTLVHMNKFVQGNGEYTFSAKADGATSEPNHFKVYWVTESLHVVWTQGPEDVVSSKHSYKVGYSMGPKDRNGKNLSAAPMPYSITGTFSKPAGSDESIKVEWPDTSSYIITGSAEHVMRGAYTLNVEWTNLMCASNSPYYKVKLTNSTYADSEPYADAGGDQEVSMSGGSATVSFDGSGSSDDGDIVQYRWDFDDGQTAITDTPTVTHIYDDPGTYYIGLIVVDDSGQDSSGRWGGSATLVINE
jgi:hypothetical protein